MNVSVLQENFVAGMGLAAPGVARRSPLDILRYFLVRTKGGKLEIQSNSMDMGMIVKIGAKVTNEGGICVPARTMIDLCGTLPPDRIDMEVDVERATLRLNCGRNESNVRGLDLVEFPALVEPDDVIGVQMNAATLYEGIRKVVIAAATDEARPILTGVLMEVRQGVMNLVTADGVRLALFNCEIKDENVEFSCLIPARVMREMAKVLRGEDGAVTVYTPQHLGHEQFAVQTDRVYIRSLLIPGSFPDFEQIIPELVRLQMVVNRSELVQACRTVQIFARDGSGIVQFIGKGAEDLEPGKLVVTGMSAGSGDGTSEMDAKFTGEGDIQIAFNVNFVLDALAVMDTPEVRFSFIDGTSPAKLVPVVPTEESGMHIHVIMPMNLG